VTVSAFPGGVTRPAKTVQLLTILVGQSWAVMQQVSAVRWFWAQVLPVQRCHRLGQASWPDRPLVTSTSWQGST